MLRKKADGYYYFADRKKDAVRLKGRNISTFEVEMVARRHPAIADCAAFGGMTDAPDGCAPQFINDNAPYFFVPRYLEQVEALPYTPTNKVQKFKLREAGITQDTWDAQKAGFKAER